MSGSEQSNTIRAQDSAHATGHDYDKGSPHLRHPQLRAMVEGRIRDMVADVTARTGQCRVVEIGAGHGTFTHQLLSAGATSVTVTEASTASAEHLRREFADDPRVDVSYDATGEGVLTPGREWDLAVIISVLHHIPDYVGFLDSLADRIAVGGGIFSVQDPLWYPRRSRLSHRVSRGSYLAWRLFQGNYGRGLATRVRRMRGVYDDTLESDLVEYHVVRQGCDEEAVRAKLSDRFDVEVFSYWSSQAPLFQRLFEESGLVSDFGIAAKNRRAS
jgi:phospholipid N-methyltransferase